MNVFVHTHYCHGKCAWVFAYMYVQLVCMHVLTLAIAMNVCVYVYL
jgi:hypothetical protein